MDTQKIRLNVTLPKNLVNMVDRMTGAKKRSMFIAEAIELKVKQTQKDLLEKQLTEGYRACQKEAIDISSEFESVDLEGWDEY
jgi:metal-responsive CopG/Arc/MetJ family transcriptional regulator